MSARVQRGTWRRPGRLVPGAARRLGGRSVRLGPAQIMDWHSTRSKEELVLVTGGRVVLEWREQGERIRRVGLGAGATAFIAPRTAHRVVNRGRREARYLYVTASGQSGGADGRRARAR